MTSNDPVTSLFDIGVAVVSLFGPGRGTVPVTGKRADLDLLHHAVRTDRLVVDPHLRPNTGHAADAAFEFLRMKGQFPSENEIARFNLLTPYLKEVASVKPEEFWLDQAPGIMRYGDPGYREMDLKRLLAGMRVLAIYMDEGRVYQVGVVSKTLDGGNPFTVKVLHSISEPSPPPPNTTLWLYRVCSVDCYGVEGEKWHAFILHPAVPRPQPVPPPICALQGIQLEASAPQHGEYSPASPSPPPPPPTGPSIKRRTPRHHNLQKYDNLSAEEILNGAIDPDEVVGSVILRIALEYSNSEIRDSLNNTLRINGKPTLPLNNITKRVTNALKSRVGHDPARYGAERAAFDAQRRG